MRIAMLVVLAGSSIAHADECADANAGSDDCNALRKHGRMSLSIGWRSEAFDAGAHSFDITQRGYVNTIGSFDGKGLAPIRANGFFIDVRLHATPYFYVGVDCAAAFAGAPEMQFATRAGEMIAWNSTAMMTMASVVGARVPIGRLSLRGELVSGLHVADLIADNVTGEAAAPLVAPRVAVDVWLHHWWAVEAFASTNLLDRSEQSFGIALGFHSQAFDGRY
jgi:hypothetical protein